jgi:hypothetical protein
LFGKITLAKLAKMKTDLITWLRHFESRYEVESDDVVMSIASNKKGYLTPMSNMA